MALVLQLFGGFRLLRQGGEPIGLTERPRALLAYLAVARSAIPRQALAALLCDTGTEQEQRTTLRQTLYLVRKATAEKTVISDSRSDLLLNFELVEADVQLFQSAIASRDRSSLETAVQVYCGPFLDGVKSLSPGFEDWLQARRAEFLEHVLEALLKLAGLDAAAGRHDSALAYARRALTLDPLREDAHRQVMWCLAVLGQRTNALRQYEVARQLLAEELGVSPEAKTTALHDAIARGELGSKESAEPIAIDRNMADRKVRRTRLPAFLESLSGLQKSIAVLTITFSILAGGITAWYADQPQPSSDIPSIAVLPFTNGSGDAAQSLGVGEELTTLLSTYPGIRVVSRDNTFSLHPTNAQQRYDVLGARYVLEGSVQKSAYQIQVMVQLVDASSGDHLWADLLQEVGADTATMKEQIAYRIYESLVGFTGEIEQNEQRLAWRKPALSLGEYDYVRRGELYQFQFTREADEKAIAIWQEGLSRFPDSAMIRMSLAALHRHAVEAGWSKHPDQDLDEAWQQGREASLAAHKSRYEQWLSHWIMAKLAQWCKEDFEQSVAEAKSAIKLLPYDATSRADLAELMANAGKTQDAIEWLQESIRRDPKGPEWYRGNLAWAYYLAGRYEDALAELQKLNKQRPLLLAATYIKLGHFDEAHRLMAEFLKKDPNQTLGDAARWPLIGSLKRGWLEDLRQAGLAKK